MLGIPELQAKAMRSLKQELINRIDYQQGINNNRFAALENTPSLEASIAKSIDQVEMDNIWDQLEVVSKKVSKFFFRKSASRACIILTILLGG